MATSPNHSGLCPQLSGVGAHGTNLVGEGRETGRR